MGESKDEKRGSVYMVKYPFLVEGAMRHSERAGSLETNMTSSIGPKKFEATTQLSTRVLVIKMRPPLTSASISGWNSDNSTVKETSCFLQFKGCPR
jgi:hypothetical protein